MSLQRFYACFDKKGRKNPVTVSGKEVGGEMRVKVGGMSKPFVRVDSHPCFENPKNTIIRIEIKNPETGETEFMKMYGVTP